MGELLESCAERPDPRDALQSVEGDAGQGGSSCPGRSRVRSALSISAQVRRYLGQIPPGASRPGACPLLPLSPPSLGPQSFYLCCFFLKMSSHWGKAYFLLLYLHYAGINSKMKGLPAWPGFVLISCFSLLIQTTGNPAWREFSWTWLPCPHGVTPDPLSASPHHPLAPDAVGWGETGLAR